MIDPALMTPAELQEGADWLYRQFYRLDRIWLRALRAALALGPRAAGLGLRLNLTYRADNRREGVVGRDPAGNRSRTGRWGRWRRSMQRHGTIGSRMAQAG